MLKAKMSGEPIQPAEATWVPEVKLRNLRAMAHLYRASNRPIYPRAQYHRTMSEEMIDGIN